MKLISQKYKLLNKELHDTNKTYGKGGAKHLKAVKKIRESYNCDTVLDYGCGKATLSEKARFAVNNYDPCIVKYSARPDPADLVVCTDVLEHVEIDLIGNVIADIHRLAVKVTYFVIALRYDKSKTMPDGSNPHKIVQPASDWIELIGDYFVIENMDELKEYELKLVAVPK